MGYRTYLALFLALIFPHLQCDTESFVIDCKRPWVYLKLERVGDRVPVYANEPRSGVWLRVVNNSRIPIIVGTFDTETPNPGIGVFDEVVSSGLPKGLGTGSDSKDVPQAKYTAAAPPKGYSSENYSTATIKPGSDLLFSVPINHLGPTWHLEVTFGLDVPGSGYTIGPHNTVSFFWKDLPEKYRKITNEHNPDR
jgi:hypothetical protein